jgi:hypothetical protein
MAPALSANQIAAAILATDFYSFVQESFPIVSGGGRLLPNWHLEALAHELTRVMKGSTIDALSQALQRAFAPAPPQAVFSTYSMFAGR